MQGNRCVRPRGALPGNIPPTALDPAFRSLYGQSEKTFQECIGVPIPAGLLPDIELLPCFDKKAEDALLFGTAAACKKPFLMQGQIGEFLESAPNGYYLIGFWGHGVNSYAFYYSRVDAWSRVFFRLPYGGVYMDNDKTARKMRAFLSAFPAFEKEIGRKSAHLVAVDAMDYGYYELHSPSGGKHIFRGSLWRKSEFAKITAWLESETGVIGEALKKTDTQRRTHVCRSASE